MFTVCVCPQGVPALGGCLLPGGPGPEGVVPSQERFGP